MPDRMEHHNHMCRDEVMNQHMQEYMQGQQQGHMGGHMHDSRYSISLPYPEIKVESKNPLYARILQDDYAGIVSEFTAVNQYVYHSLVAGGITKEIADALLGIAIVEMTHLHLLGEAIIKLGGNPVYRGTTSNMGQFWNGSYVQYSTNTRNILIDDINSEKAAIANYRRHIELIGDKNIQKLLERIIMDEELHIIIFSYFLRQL